MKEGDVEERIRGARILSEAWKNLRGKEEQKGLEGGTFGEQGKMVDRVLV